MTRRDWHALAAYATIAALLVVVFVVVLWTVLRHSANADGATVPPRPTPTVASRSLARPFLTVPPSDHAAVGRDQTSAEIQTEANTAKETADQPTAQPEDRGRPTAAQWAKLRWCESRDEYGNKLNPTHRGAYQIGFTEWKTYGGTGRDPADASPAEQDLIALRLWQARGWEPWAASSSCTGLR